MGRRCTYGVIWFLAAASLGLLSAAASPVCTGPQPLVTRLQAHPSSENAIALGNWFASHQQLGCAVQIFRAALRTDANSAQLHYLEGLALAGWGHPTEAIASLQESIRIEPKVLKPHLILASLLDQTQRSPEAEEQWKSALALDPHSIPALEGLSASLLARQDYVAVIDLLRPAPRTETLALNLSLAYGKLREVDEAGAVINDAMQLSPHSIRLANAMSVVLVQQRRYQDAAKLLDKTLQQHPDNPDAELMFLRVLVLTSDVERAKPLGRKLLVKLPHDADVLYLNGVLERDAGDYAQAKVHLEEAVLLDPDYSNSRYNLGIALIRLHEWKAAKEQLQKAIAMGAIEPQAHFELANALRSLGETDAARDEMKLYQDRMHAQADQAVAASKAGQADTELAAGDLKAATAHFREAATADPGNAGYRFKLSVALNRAGDTAGERTALEDALKIDPNLAPAHNQLGYILSQSGDSSGAEEQFRAAVRSAPGWTDAWINLAATLGSESHIPEAREAIAVALRLDPGNKEAHELSTQLEQDPRGQTQP